MLIGAHGTSKIAADFGAFILKQLECFKTVRVQNGRNLIAGDFENLKFGGYLTISQSGNSQTLLKAIKQAREFNITCFNIVNVEDSPIAHILEQLNDEEDDEAKNIGMYMKAGYCYCDVKSFIPQIVCVTLLALWFSYHKDKGQNSTLL